MEADVKFECVISCSGIDFYCQHGNIYTLGEKNSDTTLTRDTATDLVKAGHIKICKTVERAIVAPVETAMKTPASVDRKRIARPGVEKDAT